MKYGLYRGVAMSVAGSDSGGGAGIQADLKTFAALRVFGTTAVTAITVQNSKGVTGIHVVPPKIIEEQILAVGLDFPIGAVKTGMVGNAEAIGAVVSGIKKLPSMPIVVDPVMIAQSGDPLIEESAVGAIIEKLLPIAAIVTPNLTEAEKLTGLSITNVNSMELAAREILKTGCKSVLVKGGHLEDGADDVTDVFFDGEEMVRFSGSRIDTTANHGTGCTLSSAIAAELSAGRPLAEAVDFARRYLRAGLENGVTLGSGAGCLGHAVEMDWARDGR